MGGSAVGVVGRIVVAIMVVASLVTVIGISSASRSSALAVAGTTVAGGNGPGSALNQFEWGAPGVAVDSSGNVYVVDRLNQRVLRFAPGSNSSTNATVVAGGNGRGSSANQLNDPNGIAVDASGAIYVVDEGNHRVQKFPSGSTSSTNGITVAGGNGDGSATNQLSIPKGVAIDSSGNIIVVETSRVIRFPAGSTSATNGTIVGTGYNVACGVAVDSVGNIFVLELFGRRLLKIPAGSTLPSYGSIVSNFSTYGCGISVDGAGNVYVPNDSVVQKVLAQPIAGMSIAPYVAGGNGAGAAANQLSGASAVAIGPGGELFVLDGGNHRVQKWGSAPLAPSRTFVAMRGPVAEVNFRADPSDLWPATGFQVTCSSGDGGTTRGASGVASPVAVTGLTDGKAYSCTVIARNGIGVSSPSTASGTFTVGADGGRFVGITPTRALDTRETGPCLGSSGRTLVLGGSFGVPADAGAVSLNVTVVAPSTDGYVTVWPTGAERPLASNLNFTAGQVVPNMVVVKLGTGGAVELFANSGCPHMVVDVTGYFTGGPVGPGGFVGMTPIRALDTRTTGFGCSALRYSLPVGGVTVPASAVAIAANVTVVSPTAEGFLTVWPTGSARPIASNLNYTAGQVVPNMVQIKLGDNGNVSGYANNGCPDVVVDITGYYLAGDVEPGGFVGVTPVRALDTRDTGTCLTARSLSLAGVFGIPVDAVAVSLNVTAVTPAAAGYLTAWPAGTERPLASNLNFVVGQIVPNMVIVKLGNGSAIGLFANSGCPHVIVDVTGFYAGEPLVSASIDGDSGQ